MIDSIQTFGDSFLFGSDLTDCHSTGIFGGRHSMNTWPALISKDLNLKYECCALGGVGNQFIASTIFANATKNALVIVNWTWIDRFDYSTTNNEAMTLRPTGTTELEHFYYKNLHSEINDKFRNLAIIWATIAWLYERNIPFVMTIMDQLLLDDRWNFDRGILDLQKLVQKNLTFFPNNQTFLEWSRSNGYPESDNWHPLEKAHEEAAKFWLPIYEKEISKHITTNKD